MGPQLWVFSPKQVLVPLFKLCLTVHIKKSTVAPSGTPPVPTEATPPCCYLLALVSLVILLSCQSLFAATSGALCGQSLFHGHKMRQVLPFVHLPEIVLPLVLLPRPVTTTGQ